MMAMSMVGIAHADTPWTGYYTGVDAGFAVNHAQLGSHQLGFTNPHEKCNLCSDFSTAVAGMQLGYLYQLPNDLISGIEANITFNNN